MSSKNICVIGAGASGLTAIKSCKEEGLYVICFEKDTDLGGLWRYRENIKDGTPCVKKSTIINTSKEMSAFSDFPHPEHFPNFMSHSHLFKYFQLYANHFKLRRHIAFHHEVLKVEKSSDYEESGRWFVTVKDLVNGSTKVEIFDGVMVCSGHHVYPHIPKFKGLEDFDGKVLHSQSQRSADGFENQRVLVVGIGNSAVEAAVEISHVAEKVYLSTRTGSWIMPRVCIKGLPGDMVFFRRIIKLGQDFNIFRFVDRMVEAYLNFQFDHEAFQLKPKHHATSAHPTVNDNLSNCIMNGEIAIKCDITQFRKNGVVFQGEGDEVTKIDAVIFATGYVIKFPFLKEDIIQIKDNKLKLYKLMFPPQLHHPTLAFIGLAQAVGSIFPIMEAQSRWFAFLAARGLSLPSRSDMDKEIETRITNIERNFAASPRHTIQVHFIEYMDDICSQFGAKPNLLRVAMTDPVLFLACFFKPCTPYQYRLHGPHSWNGAKKALLSIDKRIQAPLNTCRRNNC